MLAYFICVLGLLANNLITLTQNLGLTQSLLTQNNVPEAIRNWSMAGFWVGVWVMPFVLPLLSSFGYTAALGFIAPFVEVRDGRFGRLYAVSLWAMVPAYLVGSIIRGILSVLVGSDKGALAVDLSLKALLPPEAPRLLHSLGLTLDVFFLWTLILIAVGFSTVHKRPWKAGAVAAMILLAFRFAWVALTAQ
jgi:hypothetical protein